jgi:hypothetical protein
MLLGPAGHRSGRVDQRGNVVTLMSDDHPILVDGRVTSVRQQRERERIERKLRVLEAEVASIEFQLEREQERADVLHHAARMFELHSILARQRDKAMGRDGGRTPGLIYKTKLNARIFR